MQVSFCARVPKGLTFGQLSWPIGAFGYAIKPVGEYEVNIFYIADVTASREDPFFSLIRYAPGWPHDYTPKLPAFAENATRVLQSLAIDSDNLNAICGQLLCGKRPYVCVARNRRPMLA